ncbi:MAG TPA: FHA domain-containing protein [Chloroflexia bacterium]|nr:FHA domain-containing protein [Chloroflexia bacterium]
MIRCPRCNTELPDGVAFCDACGAPVRGQMPPASPVYQPLPGETTIATPVGQTACPVCGTPVIPGEAFCDNCGASLLTSAGAPAYPAGPPPFAAPGPPVPAAPAAPVSPPFAGPPPAPAGGTSPFSGTAGYPPATPAPSPAPPVSDRPPRLVVVSSRAELPLPGRDDVILGREDQQSNSFPDIDFNPHGGLEQGVSRRHARITHRAGQYFLEDLNSVNGTLLNQRRIPANTPMPLRTGDHIMLGRLGLTFE